LAVVTGKHFFLKILIRPTQLFAAPFGRSNAGELFVKKNFCMENSFVTGADVTKLLQT
jgi:hypothetical protein